MERLASRVGSLIVASAVLAVALVMWRSTKGTVTSCAPDWDLRIPPPCQFTGVLALYAAIGLVAALSPELAVVLDLTYTTGVAVAAVSAKPQGAAQAVAQGVQRAA